MKMRLWTTCLAAVVFITCISLVAAGSTEYTTEWADDQSTDVSPTSMQIPGRSCRALCEADKTFDPDRCPPNETDGPCVDSAGRCTSNAYICTADDTHHNRWPHDGLPSRRKCNGHTFDMRQQADRYRLCELKKGIPDAQILNATARLWLADGVNRIAVNVSWQGTTKDGSREDKAPLPLFNELPDKFLTVPLYAKQIALFHIYHRNDRIPDPLTPEEWASIDRFLDEVMNTSVMQEAHRFLASKGLVPADAGDFQDQLWEIWYSQYKRSRVVSSCGAEHVQVGETKGDEISGLHNWIRFALLERTGHVNYLGNVRHASVGGSEAYVIRNPFFWDKYYKPTGGFFIGTSPAFDMALYTLCFYVRPNSPCPVKLGGTRLFIQTFTIQYDGHEYVGSSYPSY